MRPALEGLMCHTEESGPDSQSQRAVSGVSSQWWTQFDLSFSNHTVSTVESAPGEAGPGTKLLLSPRLLRKD